MKPQSTLLKFAGKASLRIIKIIEANKKTQMT